MAPENAIARVMRGNRSVGLAFAITDTYLVTCAHVVNAAAARDPRDASVPGTVQVWLEFPFGGARDEVPRLPSKVISWLPTHGSFDLHDVAVLGIDTALPSGVEVLSLAGGNVTGPVQMWGPTASTALGSAHVAGLLMGMTDKSRMQVDQKLHGLFRVRSGFSGGPVWQPATGRVIGILQATTVVNGGTDTYVLTTALIREALPSLAEETPPEPAPSRWPQPRTRPDISVLHLPNLRFDAGTDDLASERPDGAEGLLSDLATLDDRQRGTPDLIVVSGNLAAHAWSDEYQAAGEFLTHLQRGLGLTTDRVVILPGSTDVNAAMCEGYFLVRAGNRHQPQPPYWPKWEPFAAMYTRFYGREFPVDQPWLLTELPDLKVMVAGLNSTMALSHLERRGSLGEDQVRWFAEQLARATQRQWLRIGAMHHRPLTGLPMQSDGLLADADRFAEVLAPRLNLLLHGQPGDEGLGVVQATSLPLACPVRSSDAAATMARSYQVIRAGPAVVHMRQRHFEVRAGRWSDTISTGKRGQPQVSIKSNPADAAATFQRTSSTNERWDSGDHGGDHNRISTDLDRPDDYQDPGPSVDHLLARVREVCELRLPHAMTTVVSSVSGISYLRVAVGHAAAQAGPLIAVSQYPIGICEGTATRTDVQRFIDDVHAQYRASDSTVVSKLVYDGGRAETELYRWAAGHGVELMSLPEYQVGYDLRPYAKRQAVDLANDPVYSPDLYVPQRYQEVELLGRVGADEAQRYDLLGRLTTWLAEPQGHLIVILGAFGHGKTFLLRQLAREMYRLDSPAIPVLVQLRDLEKTHRLDELVAAQLARGGERRIDLSMFRYLLREGRIALLFDGFEELALRVSYDRAVEHLSTIVQAAEGRAKVVLAGRDQYFRTDADVASALSDRLASIAGRRLVKLLNFDEQQIEEFLTKRLGQRQALERLVLLRDVHELLGLAANPRMLDFITQIDERRLRSARTEGSEITAASLYADIIIQWLTFEARRLDSHGPTPGLSMENLLHAVVALALRLWDSGESSLGEEDLSELAETLVAIAPISGRPDQLTGPDRHEAIQLVGSHTMLVRDAGGRFTFVHRSVMEWLVARDVADRLLGRDPMPAPLLRPISPLMADFICKLATEERAAAWATDVLTDPRSSTAAGENALLIQRGLHLEATSVRLAGRDLRGQDLTARRLQGADLSGADLSEAQLIEADLSGANLSGTRLVRAKADRVQLRGTNLRRADLTSARLAGSDLSGADLTGAVLRRATLLNATISPGGLSGADTHGAALPDSDNPVPQIRSRFSGILALAVESRSGLLASAGSDPVVRLWDLETGAPIRTLTGHSDWVWAVAFSADGRWLASVGGDRKVRLWDTGSGAHIRALSDRSGALRAVAFAPDAVRLAAAGDDRQVRVWDSENGRLLHKLNGHRQPVWAVAFSGDGQYLASGGSDHVVRVWEPDSGRFIRSLEGHTGALRSIAFSPDSHTLASAGGDQVVRIWDLDSGAVVSELAGHTDWVRSVAFSPDGRHLATAGGDRAIRVWDVASGTCLLEIPGHNGWVRTVVYSPDGRSVISAGDDRVIRFWDGTAGTSIRETTGRSSAIRSVAFSADGASLISAGDDQTLRIWDAQSGASTQSIPDGTGVLRSVACSSDGALLASAGSDRIVRIRSTQNWNVVWELTGHASRIRTLAFAPDSKRLASAGDDRMVRLWRLTGDAQPSVVLPHGDPVWSVAYSADGRWLASGGSDPVVRLWELASVESGIPSQRGLTGHRGVLRALAFAPGGQQLASAGSDRVVRLWNPNNTAPLGDLIGHTNEVWSVAYSPSGDQLASAGDDRTIRIWNVRTRQQVLELAGHTNCVWSVAYSPDGRWLASCSDDGTLRLWDARTGAAKATLLTLADNGWAVLVGDGHYKLHGTPTGEFWYAVNMCRFEPGELFFLGLNLRRLDIDHKVLE